MKKTDPQPMAARKPTPAIDPGAADALAQQATAVEALAASMPYNANKSKEFGRDNAISPSAGQTQEPNSDLASASTSAKPIFRPRPAAMPPRSTGRASTRLVRC